MGAGKPAADLILTLTHETGKVTLGHFPCLVVNGDCSESVNKEFTESNVLDALIVASDYKRCHGDDILLVVVFDFLQTSELAFAGLV